MRRLGLAMLAFALLTPVLPPAGALPPGGLYGEELRVALPSTPSLDPLQFRANRIVQELAFDSLTRLDPSGRAVPWLASSWSVDESAEAITFTLRAATWADGNAITPQDVVWSYGKYLAAGVATGFSVSPQGADSVRFVFGPGGGDFLGGAGTLPIAWKAGQDAATSNGPFLLGASSASAVNLTANARHWRGRPYLDSVSFRFPYTLARNPNASTQANDAACALMKGAVHLIGWPVSQTDLTNERDCVAGFGGWSDRVNRTLLNPDPGRTVPFAGVSEDPGLSLLFLGMNAQRSPLSDPQFRQAISRAVDRDQVVGTFGSAIEPNSDIADSVVTQANLEWFNESVPRYRVPRVVVGSSAVPSLESVNAFLDEVGYLDRDGDGWRDRPDGSSFHLTLLTLDQATDPRVAKYLDMNDKLHAIGINLTREERTLSEMRAAVESDAFDLYVDVLPTEVEPAFMYDLFHTGSARNQGNLADPVLDAILERTRDALGATVRRQAVLDAQGWLVENAPIAPIVYARALYSYDRATFEGWVGGLGGIANFWSFTSVHAAQKGPLTVLVDSFQESLRSGGETEIFVRARDAFDNPVTGVDLELSGPGLAATIGSTDGLGSFSTTFTAPTVTEPIDVALSVSASKRGYGMGSGAVLITVHPVVRTLRVSAIRGNAIMESGNTTSFRVFVTDSSDGTPIAGAAVVIEVSPSTFGGSVAESTGTTNATGWFATTFTADNAVTTRYLITARASAEGYDGSSSGTSIEVSARPQSGAPPTPALDVISMVAVVAFMAAIFGAWQRRKWVKRKA